MKRNFSLCFGTFIAHYFKIMEIEFSFDILLVSAPHIGAFRSCHILSQRIPPALLSCTSSQMSLSSRFCLSPGLCRPLPHITGATDSFAAQMLPTLRSKPACSVVLNPGSTLGSSRELWQIPLTRGTSNCLSLSLWGLGPCTSMKECQNSLAVPVKNSDSFSFLRDPDSCVWIWIQ